MLDQIKYPVALWAASWAATRSIRWGIPYLIPKDPVAHSLGEKIKRVYDAYLNSDNKGIDFIRGMLGIAYDWTPMIIATMAYLEVTTEDLRKHPWDCFGIIPINLLVMYGLAWHCLVFTPVNYLSKSSNPNVAHLTGRIKPWVTITGVGNDG